MSRIVVLGGGHGGSDSGAVGPTKLYEKNCTLPIALQAGEILKRAGVTVIYTRTDDSYVSLDKRCQIANNANADLFVSVHINSATNPTATGTETWVYQKGFKAEQAAKLIQARLVDALKLPNRGVKESGTKIYVLRKTNMPAVLTEVCFINNPAEEALLRQPETITKAARAIAEGIAAYFGVQLEQPAQDTPAVSEWAKASYQKAVAKGLLDGMDPQGVVTDERIAVILNRLKLL